MAQPRKRQRLMTQEEAQDDASSPQSPKTSLENSLHLERLEMSGSLDSRTHHDSHKRLHSRHSSAHHTHGDTQPPPRVLLPRQDASASLSAPRLASADSLLPTPTSVAGVDTGAPWTSSSPSQTAASSDASAALNTSASATPSFPPLVNLVISAAFLEHSLASNPSATSMLTGSSSPKVTASPASTGSVRINTPIASSATSANDIVSAMGFPVVPSGSSVLTGITPSTSLFSPSSTQSTTFATSSVPSSSLAQTTSLSSSTTQISSTTMSASSTADASTGTAFGAGAGASASSATPSTASLTQNSKQANAVSTPVVVGSVVGGLAGICVVLVAALVFLRWYKKRRDSAFNALGGDPSSASGPTAGPEMTQRSLDPTAGAAGVAGAGAGAGATGAAFMRRLSRPRQVATAAESPRSFERVSGRKLPSQFSPGMESAPTPGAGPNDAAAAAAVAAAYPSGVSSEYTSRSHYPSGGTFLDTASVDNNRDNPFADPPHAIGIATSTSQREVPNSSRNEERFMPGPARTPVLHQGQRDRTSDQAHVAAPQSSVYGSVQDQSLLASPSLRGNRPSYIRSQASYDSARSSRFTEDV